MANVQFNSGFYKKIDAIVTPTARKAMADLAKKEARWGIKEKGELPLIMGVLEFGDPDHRFPNTPSGKLAPIPKRPWLQRSVEGYYKKELVKYVNENLPKVLRGFPKSGQRIDNPKSDLSSEKFIQGLAAVGAQNARKSWELANFTPNSPATLENKSDSRPLHGDGSKGMSADAITAWSK